jgi:hypothetical protein
MPYNIVAVRTPEETGAGLYPLTADTHSPYLVIMDESDGSNVRRLRATGLSVFEVRDNDRLHLGAVRDIPVDLYVTDARLVVASAKFDRGGGWHSPDHTDLAGMAVAGVAISRSRASGRNRGRCLVGHIRYPWLVQVGATSRTGIRTSNALRLQIRDKTPDGIRALVLEISLDKRADAPAIAQQIAQRCARFHLSHDISPDNKHHDTYQALANTPALTSARGSYAFHVMPTYYFTSPATAYLSRAGAPSE